MRICHFELGRHVRRTVETPLDSLFESEFSNAALGYAALPWIRAVHERYPLDHSHVGAGAKTGVVRTVFVEVARAQFVGIQ